MSKARMQGLRSLAEPRIKGGAHEILPHDSAAKHVTGDAIYVDDIPEPRNLLHLYFAQSAKANAQIKSMDLSAVRSAPGVVAVLSAADITGINDVSPIAGDDPLFAVERVSYVGQSIFAVAAEDIECARAAALLAKVEYEEEPPLLSIEDALSAGSFLEPGQTMVLGDADAAIQNAPRRLKGRLTIGGQDHFYLEGQIAMALPLEDGDMQVYSSTQNPSEVQHLVARVLDLQSNAVTVEVRRMGGGFGGKETQPALLACAAALAAAKTGRPVKARMDRDDDMIMTGKRHDFRIDYEAGFDDDGRIEGIKIDLASRCGYSADLSVAINDRAMFHSDNAYFLKNALIHSERCRTHTVSNTAFRGFGGPQGMMGIERVMDAIAQQIGRDPLDVRKINLYGDNGRDVTPYHMTVEDFAAGELIEELEQKADYRARRRAVQEYNANSQYLKKGIALTPVKFGISFTATHLNQAGALLHIYSDGSIHLNHGGTEMGQGLFTKVAQVVAEEFQVDIDQIKITATSTGKVPNTSPTAASSGTDLNGMAARNAAQAIKGRLRTFAAEYFACAEDTVEFRNNRVFAGNREMPFHELVKLAYMNRVSLSSTGFYKTPKIFYDRTKHRGRPFYYFAYGAAVSEVVIDTLTGESRVLRVDILHDAGKSINPALDLGQIEGGFIQGMGWLTTEELVFDDKGELKTHALSTYKIPACSDRPPVFNMEIWKKGQNREDTILRSKAVGEPPLMLAISVFSALTGAIASVGDYKAMPHLDAPATAERILMAIEDVKARTAALQVLKV